MQKPISLSFLKTTVTKSPISSLKDEWTKRHSITPLFMDDSKKSRELHEKKTQYSGRKITLPEQSNQFSIIEHIEPDSVIFRFKSDKAKSGYIEKTFTPNIVFHRETRPINKGYIDRVFSPVAFEAHVDSMQHNYYINRFSNNSDMFSEGNWKWINLPKYADSLKPFRLKKSKPFPIFQSLFWGNSTPIQGNVLLNYDNTTSNTMRFKTPQCVNKTYWQKQQAILANEQNQDLPDHALIENLRKKRIFEPCDQFDRLDYEVLQPNQRYGEDAVAPIQLIAPHSPVPKKPTRQLIHANIKDSAILDEIMDDLSLQFKTRKQFCNFLVHRDRTQTPADSDLSMLDWFSCKSMADRLKLIQGSIKESHLNKSVWIDAETEFLLGFLKFPMAISRNSAYQSIRKRVELTYQPAQMDTRSEVLDFFYSIDLNHKEFTEKTRDELLILWIDHNRVIAIKESAAKLKAMPIKDLNVLYKKAGGENAKLATKDKVLHLLKVGFETSIKWKSLKIDLIQKFNDVFPRISLQSLRDDFVRPASMAMTDKLMSLSNNLPNALDKQSNNEGFNILDLIDIKSSDLNALHLTDEYLIELRESIIRWSSLPAYDVEMATDYIVDSDSDEERYESTSEPEDLNPDDLDGGDFALMSLESDQRPLSVKDTDAFTYHQCGDQIKVAIQCRPEDTIILQTCRKVKNIEDLEFFKSLKPSKFNHAEKLTQERFSPHFNDIKDTIEYMESKKCWSLLQIIITRLVDSFESTEKRFHASESKKCWDIWQTLQDYIELAEDRIMSA